MSASQLSDLLAGAPLAETNLQGRTALSTDWQLIGQKTGILSLGNNPLCVVGVTGRSPHAETTWSLPVEVGHVRTGRSCRAPRSDLENFPGHARKEW